MNRQARLSSGRNWLKTYCGSDPVRGYGKWFGVSRVCAILELRLLGYTVSDERLRQAQKTESEKALSRARKKARANEESNGTSVDSDERFEFIAGYTAGGFLYGVEWGDVDKVLNGHGNMDTSAVPMEKRNSLDEDDVLPF